ncbi:MAG: CapA family protein [Acidimicrobiales bacterium]
MAVLVGAIAAGMLLMSTGTSHNDVTTSATTAPLASASSPAAAPEQTTSPATGPARDPTLGSGRPVTFAFAGDTNFSTEGRMAARLRGDPASAIGPFSDILSAADVAVGNLETAVGTHGSPEAKQFTYQAPPTAIDAMRAAGFDAVSMANNHGRDYGPDGLADSLAARAAQPDGLLIGIGEDDADALRPFRTTINGQRIAVIAATQVLDAELASSWTAAPGHAGLASAKKVDDLVAAVRAARIDSDTVVVFLHWGVERETCPSGDQQALAAMLAEAGADIVIGGHSHRLQGAGFLGHAFVGYGLGNFDFFASGGEAASTGVVQVSITGRRVDAYDFVPGHVESAVATPLAGAAAQAAKADWDALRPCTGLTSTAG